jgi:hypothetical protein
LDGVYDAETGMITFTVNHQSLFVAGYDPVALWINIFNDIASGAWYFDAVAYSNYYGLFDGYGGGIYAPNDSMTRAMFVTVLWNLEGRPAPVNPDSFNDILPEEWYRSPVQWAAENGILTGVETITGGVFAPGKPITRQEMAAVLVNYASFKGYDIPVHRPMPGFTDHSQIDLWAESAARKLSEGGVINGDNGEFKPHKEASRAEVAQMFKNFLRLIVGHE